MERQIDMENIRGLGRMLSAAGGFHLSAASPKVTAEKKKEK